MRVTTLVQGFAPVVGGEQRLIQRWAPLWARQGVRSTVITRRHHAHVPTRERQPGLSLFRVPRTYEDKAGSIAWLSGGLAATVASRPDVIQAMEITSPTDIALNAAAILKVPVVGKVLSIGPRGDIGALLRKPMAERRMRRAAARVDAWVCMTSLIRDELLSHGMPPERLHLMRNGVDAGHFRPARDTERADLRAELGLPQDEVVFVYCGRFGEIKRLEVTMEALASVPGHLLLVGEGPEEADLRTRAQAPEVRERITFHPPVEDTAPYLRAADVYVSASVNEGMSVSVLEAMASGLTVVASPASGMDEMLGEGAGVVCDDESAGALAGALRAVVTDPGRREAHARAAREKVETGFSLQANADAMLALYERVIAERRRSPA
jgi:glycosyltransferase involved in cell wall biosynthesis